MRYEISVEDVLKQLGPSRAVQDYPEAAHIFRNARGLTHPRKDTSEQVSTNPS
jgi:hypothetical protein